MAVMTRVGHAGALERVLQREAVHHGGQHADVVAGRAVHPARSGRHPAEDVAATHDDPDLDAETMDLGHLVGDERAERRIDAVLAVAQERFAGQLEQDAPISKRAPFRCRKPGDLRHSSSPSA